MFGKGKVENVRKMQAEATKQMENAISVFTSAVDNLQNTKAHMMGLKNENDRIISEIQESNAQIDSDITSIDKIINNIVKILS